MINWQMIIAAPAGMFLLWAGMIKVYVSSVHLGKVVADPDITPVSGYVRVGGDSPEIRRERYGIAISAMERQVRMLFRTGLIVPHKHRLLQSVRTRCRRAFIRQNEHGLERSGLVRADGVDRYHVRAAGEVIREPRPGRPAAHRRPPCDSMIDRLMRSPMPVP
jgi:hypothetical protein